MSPRTLRPLVEISRLMLDHKLAALTRAVSAREESKARLAGLSRPPAETDLPLAAAAQARVLYERWAEARRAEINLTLARQTAEWIEARDAARQAFGRADALRRLSDRG
jgi:hypothetical protein